MLHTERLVPAGRWLGEGTAHQVSTSQRSIFPLSLRGHLEGDALKWCGEDEML